MEFYVCERCGKEISEDELRTHKEGHFMDGQVYYENFVDFNCGCGGSLIKAEKCAYCKEYKNPDNFTDDVCEDCLNENATYENALKFGDVEYEKEQVAINGFVKTILGEEKINQLLKFWVQMNKLPRDNKIAEEFCLKDKYDFANWLKEQK